MNAIEIENRLGITFCERQQLVIERGEGVTVYDQEGKAFLDFTSGWGVTCLGHSHPLITNAIVKQAEKLIQCPNSGFIYSPIRAEALIELHKVLPPSLVSSYFVNSGAEANDAAIKLARKISGRSKMVSTNRSFHGRTFNTLSVSADRSNAGSFSSAFNDAEFVDYGNIAGMEAAIDSATAAVIIEPIQGEGGARVPPKDYLQNVSKLCKQYDVLLIVDEIQTGFCRTGRFFGFQHSAPNLDIDFLTMGKGLAGGYPIAAFSVSQRVKEQLKEGDHGGTYCGNPLGAAVIAAVVPYLQQNSLAEIAAEKGEYVGSALERLRQSYPDLIKEVRGRGLLWGLQFDCQNQVRRLTKLALTRGLLVVPTKNAVIRLTPPLISSQAELKAGLSILRLALDDLTKEVADDPLSPLELVM